MIPETTRVTRNTARHVNARIYRQIEANVTCIAAGGEEAINRCRCFAAWASEPGPKLITSATP